MAIQRAARPQSNFYILDKAISEDRRLSWAARGMLVYLLGKPDGWRVSRTALVNETEGTRAHNGLISPFEISGGQVVMSDAIVNNLRVDLALVRGRLQSTAIGSNGRPCVIIDMQSGELQFNGINNGSGWTEMRPGQIVVYDGAGRPRCAMGVNI